MTGNYVKTIYDPKKRPVTDYPDRLAGYILSRYHVKPHAAILDSGSGRGDFARAFARKGKAMDMDVWAIDGSHYEKAKDGGVNFIGDFDLETGRLPFADNRFDLVFSKSVLEHIHKPRQYLAEIYRVLNPEAYLWPWFRTGIHRCTSTMMTSAMYSRIQEKAWKTPCASLDSGMCPPNSFTSSRPSGSIPASKCCAGFCR